MASSRGALILAPPFPGRDRKIIPGRAGAGGASGRPRRPRIACVTMSQPVVALRGITRRFGSLLANDDVSLEIAPGEIHALVGENGAGKTTLMRVLYGLLAPDAGRIEVDGRPQRIASPAQARRLGLGMVHQHFMLIEPLTVAENIALGNEPRSALGGFRMREAQRRVEALGNRFGLPVDPDE